MGVDDIELVWAAGFFDGEGSISIHHDKRPGRKPGIHLDIEQADARPLERFAKAVGWAGGMSLRPARSKNRKPIYRIAMGDRAARTIVFRMWPWLSEPKREQFGRVAREVGADL